MTCRSPVLISKNDKGDVNVMAAEFNVSTRTIQRDLLERLSFLQLEKDGNEYRLHDDCLARIKLGDITRFASLAGLNGMLPGLDSQFIREWFDNRIEDTFQVQDGHYENLRYRMADFRTIQQAIRQQRCLSFPYPKPEGKKQVEAEPYKLIIHAGIWYLAACDQGQIKAYSFSKINAGRKQPTSAKACKGLLKHCTRYWSSKPSLIISPVSTPSSMTAIRGL